MLARAWLARPVWTTRDVVRIERLLAEHYNDTSGRDLDVWPIPPGLGGKLAGLVKEWRRIEQANRLPTTAEFARAVAEQNPNLILNPIPTQDKLTVTLSVTADMIAAGERDNCANCPVALGLLAVPEFAGATGVWTNGLDLAVSMPDGTRWVAPTSTATWHFIEEFDDATDEDGGPTVLPFSEVVTFERRRAVAGREDDVSLWEE